MTLYVLAVDYDYEGSTVLGIFDELNKAIEGKKEYRKKVTESGLNYESSCSYSVTEYELNALDSEGEQVYYFRPSKGKKQK